MIKTESGAIKRRAESPPPKPFQGTTLPPMNLPGPNPTILENIKKEPIEIKTEMPDYVEQPDLHIPPETIPKVMFFFFNIFT